MNTPKYKAAVFDLDGTVLDTMEDLTDTINLIMGESGHRNNFTGSDICNFVSSGALTAVRRALACEAGAAPELLELMGTPQEKLPEETAAFVAKHQEQMYQAFLTHYPNHCNSKTRPYDGIMEAIEVLRRAGVKTAIVSNKPDKAVQELAKLRFGEAFDLSLGETTVIRRKPHPDMVLHAMERLGLQVTDAVYLGDSEIDIQTAANCGMDCISVCWGFRSREFLLRRGATVTADRPEDILPLILGD